MARRPVDAPLGDGTAEHAARRVGPAQDYKCPSGTLVRAPFDAVRLVASGSLTADGGYALTGYATDGDYWVMQHLSARRTLTSASEGDIVAVSGNTGTKTTGPHLHHYVVLDGVRYNPEDIGLYNAPASSSTVTPFTPDTDTQEEPMFKIYKRGGAYLITGPETFLEVGAGLTQTTGVDGARALETFTRLGAQVVDMGAAPYKADDFDILRVHLRAAHK